MKITGLIFFGDSVLAGTGASEREKGCAKIVKDSLHIPVSLKGRNWNTSKDALDRIEMDVIKQRSFSHIIILFGNNDCWLVEPNQSRIPLEEFRKNMIAIARQIKKNGQIPLFCNLQLIDPERLAQIRPELQDLQKIMSANVGDIQKQYSNGILDLAKETEAGYIDIRSILKDCEKDTIALDGIHPNDMGHEIIAATIQAYLKKMDPSLVFEKQIMIK